MSQTIKRKRRKHRRIRWTRLLLLACFVLGIVWAVRSVYLFFDPLQLRASDITIEYKTKFDPKSNIKTVFMSSKDKVDIDNKVNTDAMGDYEVAYTYKGKTKTAKVHVTDTTAPKVEVADITADLAQAVVPEDFVTESSDNDNITYTFKSDADLDKEGDHEVTIVAKDTTGNTTEKEAVLHRVKDTTAPQIKAPGKDVSVLQGTEFTLDGFSVSDDMDPNPNLTYDSETLDLTKAGDYDVKILATDRSGNTAELTQKVTVEKNPEYNAKVVYLTFDDGPSANTKKVIDILKKNDAKATFFVTGTHPEYNNYIKEAYDNGNTIGLHTYTHDYAGVYSSIDAYFDDLQKISNMVEEITGEKSKVIRFPGGSSNTISANYTQGIMSQLVNLVHDKGYEYYDWNVSSGDASGNNVPTDTLYAQATACEADYCTILFHDTDAKDTTVEVLPKIIDYYKKRGYVFLGLGPNSVASHHGVNN